MSKGKAKVKAKVKAKAKVRAKAVAKAGARAAPRRQGGRRVTDKSLNLKRVPNPFAFFLAEMRQKAAVTKKPAAWHSMSQRYHALSASEKQVYEDKSKAAMQEKQQAKAQLLRERRSEQQRATASAVAETPQPVTSAVAMSSHAPGLGTPAAMGQDIRGGGAQMWLSLPMPMTSPGAAWMQEGGEHFQEATPPAVAGLPNIWQWVEQPSAVLHDLHCDGALLGAGTYGSCLLVKDKMTGETFCLKIPRENGKLEQESVKREYYTLLKLQHPNVVHAIAWISSRDGARQGYLMPLATSKLWQWLNLREITRGDGVAALVQIARGLSYIHHKCVAHMDMKPDNVLTYDTRGCGGFQVADFGMCMRGPSDAVPGDKIKSNAVNSTIYRPLDLFHNAGCEVPAQYRFDMWAFGCIVFDVCQSHPRLRSSDGRALRLFEGVNMKATIMQAFRVRNYRLTKHMEKDVVVVVVRFQPDRPAVHRMSADLVRIVATLHA